MDYSAQPAKTLLESVDDSSAPIFGRTVGAGDTEEAAIAHFRRRHPQVQEARALMSVVCEMQDFLPASSFREIARGQRKGATLRENEADGDMKKHRCNSKILRAVKFVIKARKTFTLTLTDAVQIAVRRYRVNSHHLWINLQA